MNHSDPVSVGYFQRTNMRSTIFFHASTSTNSVAGLFLSSEAIAKDVTEYSDSSH